MYDYPSPGEAAVRPAAWRQRLRVSWWILALAGVLALGLAVSIRPHPTQAPLTAGAATAKPAVLQQIGTPDEAAPVSLTDVIGKASLGLLLVYGVGWVLVRMRRGGWSLRPGVMGVAEPLRRLKGAESLPLGHQQPTLHLVEVDGTALLLGSSVDQVCVLWTSAAAPPSPVAVAPTAEAPIQEAGSRQVPPAAERRSLGGPPVRHEADWEDERSRLIRSLIKHDEVA
jgi:flagellar biogenesis protein FliO